MMLSTFLSLWLFVSLKIDGPPPVVEFDPANVWTSYASVDEPEARAHETARALSRECPPDVPDGDGDVTRSELTYRSLIDGSEFTSPASTDAFAIPVGAAPPRHRFRGELELVAPELEGEFVEFVDWWDYTSEEDDPRKHLPPFKFKFVQSDSHLIPLRRGTIPSPHLAWEYILGAGRVWSEKGDQGLSRASIPFSLHQRNENCMHNGLMSFLFDDQGFVSKVAYQVVAETCIYYKFDMWGMVDAKYSNTRVRNEKKIKRRYRKELVRRLPTRPIADVAPDLGLDPLQFGSPSETDPEHVTVYGFIADGVHYVGGCSTRYGPYPYCDSMFLPSYSTAKSAFGAVALMRLEKQYPGIFSEVAVDYIPQCNSAEEWGEVTFEHLLDMSSGNYNSPDYLVDEFDLDGEYQFFQANSHAEKLEHACNFYPHVSPPGEHWVYHTSDTYLLGTAMNAFVKHMGCRSTDIYDDVMGKMWSKLKLNPEIRVTRRTYDAVAQPFTGWGLTYTRDDVAKIGQFVNRGGTIHGRRMLDEVQLNAALQRNPEDRGFQVYNEEYRYNNGFWARESSAAIGCDSDKETWIPFMSGYGGLTILLMPNDTVYYMFSDNATWYWAQAATESRWYRDYCN